MRQSGLRRPILIMGYTEPERVKELLRYNLSQMIYDDSLVKAAAQNKRSKLKVHIKIDTGMSRFGLPWRDLPVFLRKIRRHQSIKLEGLMTHLADADNLKDRNFTDYQIANFKNAIAEVVKNEVSIPLKHALATAGTLTENDFFDLVRVGIGLYGLFSFS